MQKPTRIKYHQKNKAVSKRLSAQQLAIFCTQAGMLLRTGMLLETAIALIAQDTKEAWEKEIWRLVVDALERGERLSAALEQAGVFPAQMVQMVAVGDEAGRLDDVLDAQGRFYQRQYELVESVKAALIYPMTLAVMLFAVLVLMTTKVLPVFEQVFRSLGMSITGLTLAVMNFGTWLDHYLGVFLVLFAIVLALGIWGLVSGRGQQWIGKWLASSKIAESYAKANFTAALSMLLASGIDLSQSVDMAMKTMTNDKVLAQAKSLLDGLENGQLSAGEALEASGMFSASAVGILKVGAHSGSLDVFMDYVSRICDEDFEKMMVNRVSLIEPLTVAGLSILVGLLLVAVMLPLLGALSVIS